jgi:hypothetical protein
MSKERNYGTWIAVGGAALAVALIGINVETSQGYPKYTQGCNDVDCHGDFTDSTSPKGTVFPGGSKHEMHRANGAMETECTLCHFIPGDDPDTFQSGGTPDTPGFGCAGCHGRDYGGKHPECVGLRAHHALHGVTICAQCHFDDPVPLPETVQPPYYGSPDTLADDSCNHPPDFLEDWSLDAGNNDGLDNDGDGLYDLNDPDCSCPCDCAPPPDGVVSVGDFLFMLSQWGGPGSCDCALPPDGTVSVADFLFMLSLWGPCP